MMEQTAQRVYENMAVQDKWLKPQAMQRQVEGQTPRSTIVAS